MRGADGHSITIKQLSGKTGAAYFRWDEKRDSVPTSGALGLMALGLAAATLRRRGA